MREESETNIGKVNLRSIDTEMRQSYLDYAMSVIVARALPDVRDGMKPIHRRIMYFMGETGLRHNVKYRKSAEVVGQVMGFYHPHGNLAIYDTLVRLAQPWSLRYPLVDGQGNFGSVDGDPPAADRYTEARMTAIAEEVLADLDKDTVDFHDNYSGTKKEPDVLPSKIPQLLLNGTIGIAVGMATSIPPHNLGELIDAITYLLDFPDADVDKLMEFIPGPDFPTGGLIFNPKDIREAYATGRGKVVMRGVAEIEEDGNTHQIIISELPYQVNKAELVMRIAELVKEKKLIGIADLRDESDRDGIRVAVDLKKDAYPKKILNQLFKLTALQSTFHVNLLALERGLQPKVFTLSEALLQFLNHRRVVVTRRTQFELTRALERAHILEGLKIALDNLDAVISTIKKSATKEEAHANLMKKFKLTELQASAILEMRLSALAGLERKRVEDEYIEKQKLIAELKSILKDPKKVDGLIRGECQEMKDKYGDKRRTQMSGKTVGDFTDMDLIPNEEVVVTMSVGNYIKRQSINEYRTQRRGGKGVIGMTTKEEDQISTIQVAKNHDDILFFTNRGRVFRQKVFEIPQASRIARGTAAVNVIQLAPEEKVTALLAMPEKAWSGDFVMITKQGVIKKTATAAYANIRSNGLIAIKLDEGDELKWVRKSQKDDEVMIITKDGQSIKFKESDARPLGRSTRGVRAIKLRKDDEVIGADVARKGIPAALFVVSANGSGKQTLLSQYTLQHRGGVGIKTMQVTAKTGKVIGAKLVERTLVADVIITSTEGQIIRLPLKTVPTLGRATQGVRLMRMKNASDHVASFTVLFMEEADGKLTNPNEEMSEAELAKLPKPEIHEAEAEEIIEEDQGSPSVPRDDKKKGSRGVSPTDGVPVVALAKSGGDTAELKTIRSKPAKTVVVKKTATRPAVKKVVRPAAKKKIIKPVAKKTIVKRSVSGRISKRFTPVPVFRKKVLSKKPVVKSVAKKSGFTTRKLGSRTAKKTVSRLQTKRSKGFMRRRLR